MTAKMRNNAEFHVTIVDLSILFSIMKMFEETYKRKEGIRK